MLESADEPDDGIVSAGGEMAKGQQKYPSEIRDSSTCCDNSMRLTSNDGIMGSESNTCNCGTKLNDSHSNGENQTHDDIHALHITQVSARQHHDTLYVFSKI